MSDIHNTPSTRHSDSDEIDFKNEAAVFEYYQKDKEANQVVIFEGTVYNVKDYLPDHPGGGDLIEALLGKNIDADFEEREHTKSAKKLFKTFPIVGSVSSNPNDSSDQDEPKIELSVMKNFEANITLGGLKGKAL
jgi:cytochrome b involved in lipid metabolism